MFEAHGSFIDILEARFAAMRAINQVPDFSAIKFPEGWWIHRHPKWPEVDHFYVLDTVDPSLVVAKIRQFAPDPSFRLTVFARSAPNLIDAYARYDFVQSDEFVQHFMLKTPEKCEAPNVEVLSATVSTLSENGYGLVTRYAITRGGVEVSNGYTTRILPNYTYLSGMHTAKTARRQGLATKILSTIEYDAVEAGFNTVILCASSDGQPLYKMAGFQTVARMVSMVPSDPIRWLGQD